MNYAMFAPANERSFTQFDPFEDTERNPLICYRPLMRRVSPNSIRSRILKDMVLARFPGQAEKFHPIRSVRGY